MSFLDTKKIIASLVISSILIGSFLTFCLMFGMTTSQDMESTHTMEVVAINNIHCSGYPQNCPQTVNNNLKELLNQSPLAYKTILFIFIIVFALYFVITLLDKAGKSLSFYLRNIYIPPPSYLSLAFAQGILNSKIYNAAV